MYAKVTGRKLFSFANAWYLPFSHKLEDTFCTTEVHFLTDNFVGHAIEHTQHIRHINLYWPMKGKNVTTKFI